MSLKIGDLKDSVDSYMGELFVLLGNTDRKRKRISARVMVAEEVERHYILLPKLVIAALTRFSVLSLENGTSSAIPSSCFTAMAHALS